MWWFRQPADQTSPPEPANAGPAAVAAAAKVSFKARASPVFDLGAAPATHKKGELPLSGSEPPYRYVDDPELLAASSSYSYALGDLRTGREPPLPGARGAFSLKRQCSSMYDACRLHGEALMADNPLQAYAVAADKPCQKGYYKVMMFLGRNRSSAVKAAVGAGRRREALEALFFRQHSSVHYSVEEDMPVKDLASWLGVPPDTICKANPALKLQRSSTIPAGQEVHVPGVNCWSYLLDANFAPSIADTQGDLVRDPRTAAKDFGSLPSPDGEPVEVAVRFSSFCGAYCVREGRVAAGTDVQ